MASTMSTVAFVSFSVLAIVFLVALGRKPSGDRLRTALRMGCFLTLSIGFICTLPLWVLAATSSWPGLTPVHIIRFLVLVTALVLALYCSDWISRKLFPDASGSEAEAILQDDADLLLRWKNAQASRDEAEAKTLQDELEGRGFQRVHSQDDDGIWTYSSESPRKREPASPPRQRPWKEWAYLVTTGFAVCILFSLYVSLARRGTVPIPEPGSPLPHSKRYSPDSTTPRLDGDALYDEGDALFQAKDFPAALAKFMEAGKAGQAMGWHRAGLMLIDGIGVEKNRAEAAKAFAWAIDLSPEPLPEAFWKLAWLYEIGDGVPKDGEFSRQLRDYTLTLEQENISKDCADFLSRLWEEGKTGVKDPARAARIQRKFGNREEALLILTRGAAEGNADCLYELGRAYREGALGLLADNAKAADYFQQAGEKGHSAAWFAQAMLPKEGTDAPAVSASLLQRAVEMKQPDPEALLEWGRLLQSPDSPAPDPSAGFRFLQLAHEANPLFGDQELGRAYEKGLGTEIDFMKSGEHYRGAENYHQARNMFLKAMQNKVPGAALQLAEVYLWENNRTAAIVVLKDAVKHKEAGAPFALAKTQYENHPIDQTGESDPDSGKLFAELLDCARQKEAGASAYLARHYLLPTELPDGPWQARREEMQRMLARDAQEGDPGAKTCLAVHLASSEDPAKQKAALPLCEEILLHFSQYRSQEGIAAAFVRNARHLRDRDSQLYDPPRSRKFLQAAAAMGSVDAWRELGSFYSEVDGTTRDPIKATYCLVRVRQLENESCSGE